MAAIDKLYTNFWDYRRLVIWCLSNKPSLLQNMYDPFMPMWEKPHHEKAVANFTKKQDRYLYWHCPLDFVREYLREQCGYKDNSFVSMFLKAVNHK